MKTLITATVLALYAVSASAIEIYGDLANLDNSPAFDSAYGVEYGLPSPASADFEVSLFGLLAGNPDSDNRPEPGYIPISDPKAPRYTSLDWLTHGNPDSVAGVRIKIRPSVEIGDIVPSATAVGEPGV